MFVVAEARVFVLEAIILRLGRVQSEVQRWGQSDRQADARYKGSEQTEADKPLHRSAKQRGECKHYKLLLRTQRPRK